MRLDTLREATQRPLPPDEAAAILAEARSFAVEACGAGADPLPEFHPERPAGEAALAMGAAAAAPEALCAVAPGCLRTRLRA